MAQIIKPLSEEQLVNNTLSEEKETISKMLEIQNTLLYDPFNSKKFKKYFINYLIEYIEIINHVEQYKNYNEIYVKNSINKLHSKIFKHRRY